MEKENGGSAKTSSAEELDPRIHLELDKLNESINRINALELELKETNTKFRIVLSGQAGELEKLMVQFKKSIDRARPYFLARSEADDLQKQLLEAAVQFQRLNDVHQDAKKAVRQAEARYNTKENFDGSCQEALNSLTTKVVEAGKQKSASEVRHRLLSERFFEAEKKVHELEKLLQKDIVKSRQYFEMKNQLNSTLNDLKTRIMKLQSSSIPEAKRAYSLALCNLECISEEIHRSRSRTQGEGAAEDEREKIERVDE